MCCHAVETAIKEDVLLESQYCFGLSKKGQFMKSRLIVREATDLPACCSIEHDWN